MNRLLRPGLMGSLLVALLMAPSAIAQEKWRTGLRIIPWVADGHVKADFTGDRYQTSVVVLLTATGAVFDAEDPTCTVQAEGVELIGPSGLRASTHTFQFDSEADPETPEAGRVWSAKTPADGALSTGYVVVDCSIETGVERIGGDERFAVQEIEAYATYSLFSADSKLKTEAAVFSSDCRSSHFARFVVDTTSGARMAFALANIRDEPETYSLFVSYEELIIGHGFVDSPQVALTVPPKTAKGFFLDEVVDGVPEGAFGLTIIRDVDFSKDQWWLAYEIPFGAVALRYTDGTFSTVPAWPILNLRNNLRSCGGYQ